MIPRFESVPGPFNSVTQDFVLSRAFTADSLQVWKNERLLSPEAANGWLELDPGAGSFRMKQAPALGDKLRVFYLDTTNGVVYIYENETALEFTASLDAAMVLELVESDVIEISMVPE